nr:hypothetical protein [Polymorphobacter sp.]
MKSFVFGLMSLAFLVAAAPVPDPVRDRIIVESRAMNPAGVTFDRTTKSVRTGGGTVTDTVKVERWDGRKWSVLSINGKRPSTNQKTETLKATTSAPVPGYHRMAVLLSGATDRGTDAQGRTVLKIPVLPVGSVRTDTGDISSHLMAEATIAQRTAPGSGQPWVERVKVTAREPFRMNMLIKVQNFEQVSEYRLDANGKPRLVSQTADSSGTMFGFPGGEKTEVTYTYR